MFRVSRSFHISFCSHTLISAHFKHHKSKNDNNTIMTMKRTRSLMILRLLLAGRGGWLLWLLSLYIRPSISFILIVKKYHLPTLLPLLRQQQHHHQYHHHHTRRRRRRRLALSPLLTALSDNVNNDPNDKRQTAHNHHHHHHHHDHDNDYTELLPVRIDADDDDDRRTSCTSSIVVADSDLVVPVGAPAESHHYHNPLLLVNKMLLSRRALGQHSLATLITIAAVSTATTTCPALATSTSATTASDMFLIPTPPMTRDLYWPLGKVSFSLLPLAGTYTRRKTIQTCIIPNLIWTFDQIQGIVNVNVPVRQTIVKLSEKCGDGFWVHNPIAPTPELIQMIHDLQRDQNTTIQHIVLGTVALEHKATFVDFCKYFPQATIWIQPGQWSFPIQLPIEYLGNIPQRGIKLRELPIPNGQPTATRPRYVYNAAAAAAAAAVAVDKDQGSSSSSSSTAATITTTPMNSPLDPVWLTDFDYEILGPFQFQSVGAFSETAFYHKSTKTLIVTDVVCSVTNEPPAIIQEDARALLYHARDNISEIIIKDTPELRRIGWRRMVQFGLIFFPSQIEIIPRTISQAIQQANEQVPNNLGNLGQDAIPFGGKLYPWKWNDNNVDLINFNVIVQDGKLFCPPILTKLILDREVIATLTWVDIIVSRFGNMQRIIPGHLNNNIIPRIDSKNTKKKNILAQEFYEAFDPLRTTSDDSIKKNQQQQRPLAEDLSLLQAASDILTKYGIVAPSQACDGEPARQQGRFATNIATIATAKTTTLSTSMAERRQQ